MSGDADRLARIEEREPISYSSSAQIRVLLTVEERDALVEIAKAAREMLDELPGPERAGEIRDVRLRAAVARSRAALFALDGGTSQGGPCRA